MNLELGVGIGRKRVLIKEKYWSQSVPFEDVLADVKDTPTIGREFKMLSFQVGMICSINIKNNK
ncbi:hypothetical protein [Brumimicrobium mesophilum]|uniref:hypothetical protein n=1 Tax=Brumimicrobium mesophilum TaxID=392717 RepID=UPI00131B06D5|nr:hypothetical protein [Brumimicrobium mesophilum]